MAINHSTATVSQPKRKGKADVQTSLLSTSVATPIPALEPQLLCAFWVHGRPISVNAAYGHSRGQVATYLTREARDWRKHVAEEALCFRQSISSATRTRILSRVFGLRVVCVIAGARGDADNYLKLALDGLKGGLQIDDRYVTSVTAQHVTAAQRLDPLWRNTQGLYLQVWLDDLRDLNADLQQPDTRSTCSTCSTPSVTGDTYGRPLERAADRCVATDSNSDDHHNDHRKRRQRLDERRRDASACAGL